MLEFFTPPERPVREPDFPGAPKPALTAPKHSSSEPGFPANAPPPPLLIDTTRLPDVSLVKLRGREADLARLDAAWDSPSTHVLSVIAFGGMGKTALATHWVDGLVGDGGRGAAKVLAWSFYSQGTHKRMTSADGFLDWAVKQLGLADPGIGASAKAAAIAGALGKERILLVLDGVEPLQHGPGPQFGQLKDQGLRELLRRAAQRPAQPNGGLVLVTSRETLADLTRWRETTAPEFDLAKLSEEAGAQLLGDRGVKGPTRELRAAAKEFGGHALTLTLLGEFLKRLHGGDVYRRDRIGPMTSPEGMPLDEQVHGHAIRVLESMQTEWLGGEPLYGAIMRAVGLFDRPASRDCLTALREKAPHPEEPPKAASRRAGGGAAKSSEVSTARPRASRRRSAPPQHEGSVAALRIDDGSLLPGLEPFQRAGESELNNAIFNLRAAGLLLPDEKDGALDAHPLVREFFGERFRRENEAGWKAAHGRLYEFLRDSTEEGDNPELAALEPLFQAIPHGCKAGRQQETLRDVYTDRICRRDSAGAIAFHAQKKLGAIGPSLAALAWFFDQPFETPHAGLTGADQSWVLSEAAFYLGILGRQREALPAQRAGLAAFLAGKNSGSAIVQASNLAQAEAALGELAAAESSARQALDLVEADSGEFRQIVQRCTLANIFAARGERAAAETLFAEAAARQRKRQPSTPLLYSVPGFWYCDFRLAAGGFAEIADHARQTLAWVAKQNWVLDIGLDHTNLARAALGLALTAPDHRAARLAEAHNHAASAIDALRRSNRANHLPSGLLARARLHRAAGKWDSARADLDEVDDICAPPDMRLHLCDMQIERARLALARSEAFAPFAAISPAPPSQDEKTALLAQAREALAQAANLIAACGYHKRDAELAELREVMDGGRTFAALPPRV